MAKANKKNDPSRKSKIIYTLTDEAPLLATHSLLPIIRTFTAPAGIEVAESDISVAARLLGQFPDYLSDEQKVPDNLAELGRLTQFSDTNIIKLPNISASVPQLNAAIDELQSKGFKIPDFPEEPETDKEADINKRYSKVLGSAVNPVLREGNSDRRAPAAVKRYAQKHPHSMEKWSQASRTHVSHMHKGDFYDSEKSMTIDKACTVSMVLETKSGKALRLKEDIAIEKDEVIDSMYMSKKALCDFYEEQ
ncbi:MAG: NADP-dependent isocitrate dehydrogenase, partial [Gammaproteobacteria bacterium]|nr:NADP-dependent isocitrate dehydrogenase [Gammaproteobacteria bacterium]NNL50854.1 NADP-dependent isocitrate dehydrogenase [Woeseiaceae bacterium]